ncbi:hypothetical protein C8Q72DRAFT_795741 [Fomitopsis betulina]|nr:hypothetical protein C8Q72DRAFT_795741 [Fomitopsis betulina]
MADADARTLYGDRPPMIGPPPDRWSGGHEASQFVDCGWDGMATTSLVDTLSTSSPRESESSPRSEVACRTLAVAVGSRGTAHTSRLRSSTDGQCIAGYGACKIAAWQSTLCADPRDVEMMCAGRRAAGVRPPRRATVVG